MTESKISIDDLKEFVKDGGTVRTGVDIYSSKNILLLSSKKIISDTDTLRRLEQIGVKELEINQDSGGGVWDLEGKQIGIAHEDEAPPNRTDEINWPEFPDQAEITQKIKRILEQKQEAKGIYERAKKSTIEIIENMKASGGDLDYSLVENTVMDIFNFITQSETAFSYLTKELFSYDHYLYNHSLNVCIIGTAVAMRFNEHFSSEINQYMANLYSDQLDYQDSVCENSFSYFLREDLFDISIGFFLHDIGKVVISDKILNKKGALSQEEYDMVKKHSLEHGAGLLVLNRINSLFIKNIVQYHHSFLFQGEKGCYPTDRPHNEIPIYVKICKLADMYDAMTSMRAYKSAMNPISVVTDLFHKYAHKDKMLQYILHSFVNTIGIYPPGSLVFLRDGRMSYIIDSKGPLVIPFTDAQGLTIEDQQTPIDLGEVEDRLKVDRRKPVISPAEVYDMLPSFVKEAIM